MRLSHRVRAAERTADRSRGVERRPGVCARIEVLSAAYLTHPPTFAPAIEAGICAAVERQLRADEHRCGTSAEERP